MYIQKIIDSIKDPKPYDEGTAVMWTDEYISKQLLKMHINPDNDMASRNEKSIDKTIRWIIERIGREDARILDLGCGPGLYAEKLGRAGYSVTGIDFSATSIAYAKHSAEQNGLSINYMCMDYMEFDEQDAYDLIMLIYCDFGVLSVEQRNKLLSRVYRALKEGGVFILDALNRDVLKSLRFEKSWEMSQKGFWRDKPYLCLTESFHYPEEKATLDQHVVIEENGVYDVYRFWNHYFDDEDMFGILKQAGFYSVLSNQSVSDGEGLYDGTNVTFYSAVK